MSIYFICVDTLFSLALRTILLGSVRILNLAFWSLISAKTWRLADAQVFAIKSFRQILRFVLVIPDRQTFSTHLQKHDNLTIEGNWHAQVS